MLKTVLAACALLCALTINAEARQRHKSYLADPACNVTMPCEGVTSSKRGEMIARQLGFGAAQKRYSPRASAIRLRSASYGGQVGGQLVAHPSGCPRRAFCGCGAAVRIFGQPVRALWLAAAWFKFPRAPPAAGMVAVRRHHVFVLEAHIGGSTWLAYDANSGGHATRIHARSIAGYAIVNPRA
jgi:hypothetical protein